jgi:hypothetical protein
LASSTQSRATAARTQGDGSPPANAPNGESPTDSRTQIGFHEPSITTSHVDHSQSRTVAPRPLPAAKHRITAASLRRREISPPKALIRSGEKEKIIPCDIAKLLGPISDPERHLPWISPTATRLAGAHQSLAMRPKSHRINAMHREASDELRGVFLTGNRRADLHGDGSGGPVAAQSPRRNSDRRIPCARKFFVSNWQVRANPHVQVTTTALTKSLIGGVGGGGLDPFLLALMAAQRNHFGRS